MKRLLRQWLPGSLVNRTRHLRFLTRPMHLRLRSLDNRQRLNPSFLIIGAMKAGTTSLFRYLSAHPQIAAPIVKEINYFNFNWSRPMGWYLAHFPVTARLAPGAIAGEASPGYLVHPRAARRVHERLPDTRIIVLLRDPVARAISHYFHERRIGCEVRPIDEALFSPEASTSFTLTAGEELQWYEALNGGSRRTSQAAELIAQCPMHRAYLTHSRYADHLPAWLARFDRKQILVLRSEDLFLDPGGQLARATDFLGLESVTEKHLPAHNTGNYPESVSHDLIARLEQEFVEPNRRLTEILGGTVAWEISSCRTLPTVNRSLEVS